MSVPWKPLSDEDLVAFVGLLAPKIVRVGDLSWCEVRTFFYRPLLPLVEYHPDSIRPPLLSFLGGIQYAVPPEATANSHLNWLLFDQTKDYSLASLDKKRRRQVKLASEEFSIRPLTDVLEFKDQAHPVYLSFYKRTHYKVGARRQDPAYFAVWADTLFRIPDVLILGAYRNGVLSGISISYQVRDIVNYATFFCNDEALERYLSDLMLHTVRTYAATAPDVKRVFVGMFKGISGLDDFYLLRGAKLVKQRARLQINPLTRFLLKTFLPRQYAQLLGNLTAEQILSASKGSPALPKAAPDQTSTAPTP